MVYNSHRTKGILWSIFRDRPTSRTTSVSTIGYYCLKSQNYSLCKISDNNCLYLLFFNNRLNYNNSFTYDWCILPQIKADKNKIHDNDKPHLFNTSRSVQVQVQYRCRPTVSIWLPPITTVVRPVEHFVIGRHLEQRQYPLYYRLKTTPFAKFPTLITPIFTFL